jgi:hypothetical protein
VVIHHLWLSVAHQSVICGYPLSVICGRLLFVVIHHLWSSIICGYPLPIGLPSVVIRQLLTIVCGQPLTIIILSVSHRSLSAFISHHREDHLALSTPLDLQAANLEEE